MANIANAGDIVLANIANGWGSWLNV